MLSQVAATTTQLDDSRMIVDSTALPSDSGFTVSHAAGGYFAGGRANQSSSLSGKLHEYVEKVGSNRFQVQVSEKDIEAIKQ